ncbi:hypothetical protein BG015_008463 [Linnemannia schmuckeri]|uniref:TKL/LISK/LISK-DD1 protein kinase n=1 Tax=Linnemannia schmuckeri TaxID=64567 RepID=A0A9P5RZF5_9FUNG|nr:hypothetical protein BG015_008463 [Linnemannia schmuckeri]
MRIQWTDLKTYDIIGSGSFGRVFHGDLLGTEVAIKECVRSDSRAFDEKYFKREVDILKQSRHPNIVQFMGICKRRKRFYIITEFLPMGNLRRWIQDDRKEFGWDTRISFAIDISLALAYLHHKNIIHRDLKGENLLISENMRIKVCDFGFSRVEAKNAAEMSRISYCGTDGYMAPEILLGEDFDCSVDVFSFGIILCEMMARHVVDSQHFQRIAPDMGVSPDEILFRAQPGCPIELGELAINCVQPLPQNRPVLRQIVERLTAIENVDVHVGTTLVVAPSVARAARNMARKREADAERAQEQAYQQARMRNGYPQDDDPQPHHAHFDSATSSVRGQANTWRMTDESNGGSSRMIPDGSIMVGSQSTYKGKRRSPTDDSTIPLVLEARYRRREKTSVQHKKSSSSDDSEDVHFRMPLWDSINSPYNQQELRDWHETESAHISTIKGGTALMAWDQEREEVSVNSNGNGNRHDRRDRRNPSELSSLQLDLDDDDGDEDSDEGGRRGSFTFSSSGSSNEDDDEDNSSLFYENSDDSDDDMGAVYGHSRAPGESRHLYELSSDSDETQSTNSLTESVVLALDTLEIPDLLAARESDTDKEPRRTQAAKAQHHQAEPSNGNNVGLQRNHSLTSRLLPPIPAADNPWISEASGQQSSLDDSAEVNKVKNTGLTHTNESSAATMTTAPSSPQRQPIVEEREMDDCSLPPAPPSKTSLLLRNNTIKSTRGGGSVSPVPPEATVAVSPDNKNLLSPTGQGSASTTGTTNSSATSSAVSGASSPASIVSPDEKSSQDSMDHSQLRQDKTEKQEKVGGGGRGFGLIRGMSDSFWGPSTSTAAPEHSTTTITAVAIASSQGADSGGGTITSTLVAAMSAKTWTSGVGGFGQWIGPASPPLEHDDISSSPPPHKGKAGGLLKRHTSLKEGKQQQQQRAVANFERMNGVINEGSEGVATVGVTMVKKRAPKTLTGISHRFSLVGVSALLLPKCDVCHKRLGVLPGWASKHLECDDCGYKCHPRCVDNVPKCCTSARKSGIWEIPV